VHLRVFVCVCFRVDAGVDGRWSGIARGCGFMCVLGLLMVRVCVCV